MSGLDIDALLGTQKRARISPENAIPEFRQMLEAIEDPSGIADAAKQFSDIIEANITRSFGDVIYEQVIAQLDVLREELRELEEPELWNDFLQALKSKLLSGKLGGDRKELWYMIRLEKLGLVTTQEEGGQTSLIRPEDADQLWTIQ